VTASLIISLAVVVGVGVVICTWIGGFVVGGLIDRTVDSVPDDDSGLHKAGRWIGYTERFLIYVFVLAGSPTAIALLVAAKSLMRLDKIGDAESDEADSEGEVRAVSEYIILGTLLSFSWGVLTAYLVNFAVETWILG